MSQNNDQSRPTPSQSWYDNGQVPQSKKFPFGAGAGGDESATRMSPQIDQNGQGNTPPYGQQPATSGSQAPQFGDGQNFGGTAPGGQNYGGQNYGGSQPGNQPYADNGQGQPQQYQQPAQPQSGQPGGYTQQPASRRAARASTTVRTVPDSSIRTRAASPSTARTSRSRDTVSHRSPVSHRATRPGDSRIR
jgi:hypothetical protein